jgi:capsid protein
MNPLSAIFGRGKAQREEINKLKSQVQTLSAQASAERGYVPRRYYGQKWDQGLSNPHPVINYDHEAARRQVRAIVAQSTQAAALVNRNIDITIDSGLTLAPEPDAEILGITEEEAAWWAATVASRFDLWAQSKKCYLSETMNFYTAQRLLQRYMSRDGEAFVALSYSSRADLPNPLQFVIIDPDQIHGNNFTSTAWPQLAGADGTDGIVRDANGKEIAYRIYNWDIKTGMISWKEIPAVGRSGRPLFLHGFDPEFSGQSRGYPSLINSVQDLQNILDLSLAEAQKSLNQSNVVFTLKNNSGRDGEDPFLTDMGGAAPRPSDQFGNNPTPPANAQNVTEESLEPVYSEIPHTDFRKPGSVGVFGVPSGVELIPFGSTAPGPVFDAFVNNLFSFIAASQGSSIEVVKNQFAQNYSASRATLILTWRVACQQRYSLATNFLYPLYEAFLVGEIGKGTITAPGWQDPVIKLAWLESPFHGKQPAQHRPHEGSRRGSGVQKHGVGNPLGYCFGA